MYDTIISLKTLFNNIFTGAIARSFAFFGRGTGSILLDQVGCRGTETRLVDCPSNPIGIHDCSHFEDAGVTCQGTYVQCHTGIQINQFILVLRPKIKNFESQILQCLLL